MTGKAYTYRLLIALAIILSITGLFNFIINPFDLFPVPVIGGLNRIKIETEHRQRLAKPYIVAKQKPEAVIIGTSRALQIDAHHPAFKPLHAYNLALASATAYENYRYLQHAEAEHPLKLVIYGLDAFAGGGGTYTGFSEDRLAVSANDKPNHAMIFAHFKDYVPALLSFDALRSSINTIAYQPPFKVKNPRRYMRAIDRKDILDEGGHHRKFVNIEASYLREAIQKNKNSGNKNKSVSQQIANLTSLQHIIRFSYQHNIKLIIFISPSHARMMEVWRVSGEWSDLENWKRAVIAIDDEEAKRAGKEPFAIWDFTGYNSITTEPVPAAGDKHTEMKWYTESSHYTMDTGDLILDRILGYHQAHHAVPADFGVKVDRSNIEADLTRIRHEQSRYINTHPADVAEVTALAKDIARHL